jgi:hypothetical protein
MALLDAIRAAAAARKKRFIIKLLQGRGQTTGTAQKAAGRIG